MEQKVPNVVEQAVAQMVQATIRQGLLKGVQPTKGVVVLSADNVRDILYATFPHLRPDVVSSEDSTNITLSYSEDGVPVLTHVNLKTGETCRTHLQPDTAVTIGTMMIQFGALSKAGVRPPPPIPEVTHDVHQTPQ